MRARGVDERLELSIDVRVETEAEGDGDHLGIHAFFFNAQRRERCVW